MSQPTAIRPSPVSSAPRSSSARRSTTVLATERQRPNTSPEPHAQPQRCETNMPSSDATAICARAPGTAILRTAQRSFGEKCRPTPNMSRITPISASCEARPESATKPGVNGPTATPGEEVPDERRHPETNRDKAEDERQPQPSGDRRDERRVFVHRDGSLLRGAQRQGLDRELVDVAEAVAGRANRLEEAGVRHRGDRRVVEGALHAREIEGLPVWRDQGRVRRVGRVQLRIERRRGSTRRRSRNRSRRGRSRRPDAWT